MCGNYINTGIPMAVASKYSQDCRRPFNSCEPREVGFKGGPGGMVPGPTHLRTKIKI